MLMHKIIYYSIYVKVVPSKLRTKWCGVVSTGFTVLKSNIK